MELSDEQRKRNGNNANFGKNKRSHDGNDSIYYDNNPTNEEIMNKFFLLIQKYIKRAEE